MLMKTRVIHFFFFMYIGYFRDDHRLHFYVIVGPYLFILFYYFFNYFFLLKKEALIEDRHDIGYINSTILCIELHTSLINRHLW